MSENLESMLRGSLDSDEWQITPERDVIAAAGTQVRRVRRRRRLALGSVVAVVAVVVAGGVIKGSSARPSPAAPSTPTPPPSAVASGGIVRAGDLVRVQGTVYQPPGGSAELCGVLDVIDTSPPDVSCGQPLVLSELNRRALTVTSGDAGVPGVLGSAMFTGIWHPGRLDVRSQVAPAPSAPDTTFEDSLKHVPCAAPKGGWKAAPGGAISPVDMGGIEHYKAKHPADVLSIAFFHPAGATVIVLASADRSAAVAALGAKYAGRLCVVQSRWTKAQVAAVHDAVHKLGMADPDAGLLNGGTTAGPDGQLAIGVSAIARDPAVDRLLRQAPQGLIQFSALLQPAR